MNLVKSDEEGPLDRMNDRKNGRFSARGKEFVSVGLQVLQSEYMPLGMILAVKIYISLYFDIL